jgi:hypothetical protein
MIYYHYMEYNIITLLLLQNTMSFDTYWTAMGWK